MTEATTSPTPTIEWDLVDRLGKSLRLAGLKPGQMAKHLDVHRNTVGGWMRGQVAMNKATLLAWAAKCSETSPVPITYEWLSRRSGWFAGETGADQPIPVLSVVRAAGQQELPFPLDARPALAAVS